MLSREVTRENFFKEMVQNIRNCANFGEKLIFKISRGVLLVLSLLQQNMGAMSFIARQSYPPSFTNFKTSSESYVGPSSYTTSFGNDFSNDYPGYGNFGSLMSVRNPQISSSYETFGPYSGSNDFGSTSYTNYPPSIEYESLKQPSYSSQMTAQSFPTHAHETSQHHYEEKPISQHVEITKPIVVPVYKKFPYPVAKKFSVLIPHPGMI